MGRTAGRDAEATRRLILDAAAEAILQDGPTATIEQIAARAGVSKGGLLYHFASKNDLVEALTRSLVLDFREQVQAAVDPDDDAPGKLLRAYVRVEVDPNVDATMAQDRHMLETLLVTIPVVRRIWQEDDAWWEAALLADGVDVGLRDLVQAAADGAWAARGWGDSGPADRVTALRDRLLAMTRPRPSALRG